ncbi:AraC family transcriptional regulator [uncultured Caulobacter sp.]|uniref:AraC family transcriptional regulator n=1 Tax=uncultured Caulobacter sp. TaxID=158749 RepID=UPI0026095AE5|nr:AraC family transcriptional regulator [uncultured Caulobacter sp.]
MNLPAASAHAKVSRYAPGAMAAHSHETPSLTLVLNGRYEETIRGRADWHRPGALLFYPPGEPHAQRFAPTGALKLSLSPKPAMLDYLSDRLPLAEAPVAVSSEFARLGRRMTREIRVADAFSPTAIEGLSWELIALFARHAGRDETGESAIVAKAREAMVAHLDRPLSVARLAALCDVHPARLARAFRRETGLGPGEHQRALRLRQAHRLIGETDTPLSEVALSCGFCDQSHLSRAFKAAYGCAPMAFRRGA